MMSRNVLIAGSVIALHIAALWAMQSGLLRRAVELVVPAEILVEFISPPAPKVVPPPPAPQKPTPVKQPVAKAPVRTVDPLPLAIADTTPTPNATVGVMAPAPVVAQQVAAPVAAPPAPAPVRVELPSSDADYLQNPKPAYPPLSKRLGEQGKVVVRAFIEANGTATKAEVRTSSGYDRLDQAALQTVLKWRYVPGKRAGVIEGMWFNVPIHFVLE